MHTSFRVARFSFLMGVLLLATAGCDYTAQKGGTVDLRLSGSALDFSKAVVTLEYAALVPTVNGSHVDDFGRGYPNVLPEKAKVDLASLQGSLDSLLSRARVQPGKYDQLRLIFADSALVHREENGKTIPTTLGLSDKSTGKVAIQFDSVPLNSENKRMEITLDVDLQTDAGSKTDGEREAKHFTPIVTTKSIATGERR